MIHWNRTVRLSDLDAFEKRLESKLTSRVDPILPRIQAAVDSFRADRQRIGCVTPENAWNLVAKLEDILEETP